MAEGKVTGWLICIEWEYVPRHLYKTKSPKSYLWAEDDFKLAATISKWTSLDTWIQTNNTSYGDPNGWSKQRIIVNKYTAEQVEL